MLGIAGTDDKVEWLKGELGFDDALNYKDKDFAKNFKLKTKDLIDVFFDNSAYVPGQWPYQPTIPLFET